MRRRALVAVVLLAVGIAAPAGAHDGGHSRTATYPPLPPATQGAHSATGAPDGRTVERRMRRIEEGVVGRAHAIEHAEARHLAARMRSRTSAHAFTEALQPVNDLPPQVGGFWEPSRPLPAVAIHAVQLHTGKVLYFSYPWRATEPDPDSGQPGTAQDWDTTVAYLYDPATGASQAVPPPVNPDTGKVVELFCAGQSLMADGRVLVTGGNVGDPAGGGVNRNHGLNTTYVFDADAFERGQNPWTEGQRMRQGRWYPTQTLLPDGRTMIMSGQANGLAQPRNPTGPDGDGINRDIEIHVPDEQGGTIERLDDRLDGPSGRTFGRGERPPEPGQYPRQTLMPSGDLLTWGPFKDDTWSMTPPAPGARRATYVDRPPMATHHQWAGGVPVPGTVTGGSSKVLLVGGANRTDKAGPASAPSLSTTTVYDEARPGDGWQAGPTLNVARSYANTVLLPDGKVAVVGGGNGNFDNTRYYRWTFGDDPETPAAEGDQRRVELLDPASLSAGAEPVVGNAQAEGRTYHSVALLLPDGRVWSAGDDINGPRYNPQPEERGERFKAAQRRGGGSGVRTDTAEVWSPPYLFEADGTPAVRPEVVQAPATIPYGGRFGVRTRGDAAKAVLVAAGATTHAVDMSQRMVTLARPEQVTRRGVNLEAPSNPNIAPPGLYMLFVLDADGTPSTAAWVRIDPRAAGARTLSDADPPTDPDAPPAPGGVIQPESEPLGTAAESRRLSLRVRLSLPSTLERLQAQKRFSAVVTVNAAATVRLAAAQETRRRVKVRGRAKRVLRTVPAAMSAARRVTLRGPGARRIRVRLSRAAVRRLRAGRTATLRIVVTAKPRAGGKAVRVVRRPVLR